MTKTADTKISLWIGMFKDRWSILEKKIFAIRVWFRVTPPPVWSKTILLHFFWDPSLMLLWVSVLPHVIFILNLPFLPPILFLTSSSLKYIVYWTRILNSMITFIDAQGVKILLKYLWKWKSSPPAKLYQIVDQEQENY